MCSDFRHWLNALIINKSFVLIFVRHYKEPTFFQSENDWSWPSHWREQFLSIWNLLKKTLRQQYVIYHPSILCQQFNWFQFFRSIEGSSGCHEAVVEDEGGGGPDPDFGHDKRLLPTVVHQRIAIFKVAGRPETVRNW